MTGSELEKWADHRGINVGEKKGRRLTDENYLISNTVRCFSTTWNLTSTLPKAMP